MLRLARSFAVFTWAAVLVAVPVPALGDLRIEVRGRMRLELDRIERSSHDFVVSGALLDETSFEPMSRQTVALHVDRLDENGIRTDAYDHAEPVGTDGTFRFRVPAREHTRYAVSLFARGVRDYGDATPVHREVDLGRRNLELRIIVANEISAAATTLPLVLEAVPLEGAVIDPQRGEDLAVDLEVDGASAGVSMQLHDGRGSLVLPLPVGSTRGEIALRARFAGDEQRAPAEASVRVRIVERFELALRSDATEAAQGRDVALHGTLRLRGQSVPGVAISLTRLPSEDGRVPVGNTTATTDDQGEYRVAIAAPEEGAQARFQASVSESIVGSRHVAAATSEIVVLAINPRFSFWASARHPTGLALLVELLLVVGLLGLRFGSLLRASATRPVAPIAAAVVAPERGFFGTLRQASDRRVGGRVEEADRKRALVGALVSVRVGSEVLSCTTDAAGNFSFPQVPDGHAEISVDHPGYKPDTRESSIPHRGTAAALTITLVPWRAEILRRYAEALAPLLPPNETLGERTPRELARLAERKFGDRAGLRSLQHLVEARCFGAAAAARGSYEEVTSTLERLGL